MKELKLKKRYGQNFLVDRNIVSKILQTIKPKQKNLVIEIGCGSGNLTTELCKIFDKVIGYEIDKDLQTELNKNLLPYKNHKIIFDDFLKRNIKDDLKEEKYNHLYVIANLPYYITTPIIEKIINEKLDIEVMRLMVQKEVGERFTAFPGTKAYSSITVYLNYNYEVRKDFIVKRTSFKPMPNVDSLIISFYKKEKIYVKDEDFFYKLVRDSFSQKRKTLKNNLKGYDFEKIKQVLEKHNLKEDIRAEALNINIFCEIANILK